MYDRIEQTIIEGSSRLPSILKVNAVTASSSETDTSIVNGKLLYGYVHKVAGTVGDKYNEFAFEFTTDLAFTGIKSNFTFTYSTNIEALRNLIVNDSYITISKNYLVNNFKIFEINDYSYQAMTLGNYDFYPKLFMTVNGQTYKVSAAATAIVKSYTLKKAWILFDKAIFNEFDKHSDLAGNKNYSYTLLIDFVYKFYYDEYSSLTFKYQNPSARQNIQGLFRSGTNVSPYFDRYYSDSNRTTVLSRQANYFKLSILDLFKEGRTSSEEGLTNAISGNIYRTTADSKTGGQTTRLLSDDELKDTITAAKIEDVRLNYTTDATAFLESAAYEVYRYSYTSDVNNVNKFFGKRCFAKKRTTALTHLDTSKTITSEFYEVYPISSDMLHYMFNISNSTNPQSKDIHAALLAHQAYQWDYDFNTFSVFTDDQTGIKHVEVIMPFMENYIPYSTVLSGYNTDTLKSTYKIDKLNDYRSAFDPTILGQIELSQPATSKVLIPIYGVDEHIRSIFANNTEYISLSSPVLNISEIRDATVTDKYFNILSVTKDTINSTDDMNLNTVKDKVAIDNLKNVGFRNENATTASKEAIALLNDLNVQELILARNIRTLIGNGTLNNFKNNYNNYYISNHTVQYNVDFNKETNVNEYLAMIIYVSPDSPDYNSLKLYLPITINYYYYPGNGIKSKNVNINRVLNSVDDSGLYVIPLDFMNYARVTGFKIDATITSKNKIKFGCFDGVFITVKTR